MSIYPTFLEIKKIFGQLPAWLDKAAAFAEAKKFDPNTLLQARLAPDMFPLVRQIQIACDQAKFAGGRVADKELPTHPDTETTFDELRARIAAVQAYLEGFTAKDFEGAAGRTIALPRWEGKTIDAESFFFELAVPNCFFHITMVYAILRHNGVELGKLDYLGPVSLR